MKTVVGMYRKIEDARQVVQALQNEGFNRDDISLVTRDEKGQFKTQTGEKEQDSVADGAAMGAGTGAVLGGLGGLLVGLGALAIPGIGPVLAAGPLVSALAGAGIGAAAGGLIGALIDLGVPEEQANLYAEGVRRGATLVTLSTDDARADRAIEIMNRFNPIDINQRGEMWGSEDKGFQEREMMEDEERIPVTGSSPDVTFPVVEEDIRVGKRDVETGGVHIESHIVEEPVEEDINLRREHIDVERRPVDRPATDKDFQSFKEGEMDLTEHREEPVVEKSARVTEEIHVSKDVEEERQTIRDTVRRTEVDIERLGENYRRMEPRFREHYTGYYGNQGQEYDYYRPAYAYGYELAQDQRYRGQRWDRIEPEARRDWERRSGGQSTWEQVKDAVRHAWESVTR